MHCLHIYVALNFDGEEAGDVDETWHDNQTSVVVSDFSSITACRNVLLWTRITHHSELYS